MDTSLPPLSLIILSARLFTVRVFFFTHRIIPTFPLPAPARARATKAIGRLVENPHSKLVTIVFVRPTRITDLRPNRSLARPQGIPVRHWQILNIATAMPAHFAISVSGTPKDSIISGRYGKTLVRAIGSANRQSAEEMKSIRLLALVSLSEC